MLILLTMDHSRVFLAALLISIGIHGILLFGNFNLTMPWGKNRYNKITVTYLKEKPAQKSETKKEAFEKRMQGFLKIPEKIINTENKFPPKYYEPEKNDFFKKNSGLLTKKPAIEKPAIVKPGIISLKKKITLPPVDMDKINNPTYLSYYQIVREKIRRAAYQNYSRTEVGEVFVSFVVSSSGEVKEARLVENKTKASSVLCGIALRSVHEASPFPVFPKELDYPQLSFNVVISFEIE